MSVPVLSIHDLVFVGLNLVLTGIARSFVLTVGQFEVRLLRIILASVFELTSIAPMLRIACALLDSLMSRCSFGVPWYWIDPKRVCDNGLNVRWRFLE